MSNITPNQPHNQPEQLGWQAVDFLANPYDKAEELLEQNPDLVRNMTKDTLPAVEDSLKHEGYSSVYAESVANKLGRVASRRDNLAGQIEGSTDSMTQNGDFQKRARQVQAAKYLIEEATALRSPEAGRHIPNAVAVIFGDVNGLKGINDMKGHTMGDLYIIAMSRALKIAARSALAFRNGGDEMIVLTPWYAASEDPSATPAIEPEREKDDIERLMQDRLGNAVGEIIDANFDDNDHTELTPLINSVSTYSMSLGVSLISFETIRKVLEGAGTNKEAQVEKVLELLKQQAISEADARMYAQKRAHKAATTGPASR